MFSNIRIKGVIIGLITGLLFFTTANAALFTASLDSVDPDVDLSAFTIWLDVQNDFSIEAGTIFRGGAVPNGWTSDSNIGTIGTEGASTVAKFGYSDFLAIIGAASPSPLLSGNLFTFEYTGKINGLYLAKFGTLDTPDIFNDGIYLSSIDENGAVFSAVPIPSALLLLGSGLVGLVGLRRKA